MQMTKR